MPGKDRVRFWLESPDPAHGGPAEFDLPIDPDEIISLEICDVVQAVAQVKISMYQKEPLELRFENRRDAVDFASNLWRRRMPDSR